MDFRSFAEDSRDALVLVRAGRIVYLNPAARASMGQAGAAWEGRGESELGWATGRTQRWPVQDGFECIRLREAPLRTSTRDQSAAEAGLGRLAMALDLSSDAFFLVDAETAAYLHVNAAACRLLGRTRAEMLGPVDQKLHLTKIPRSLELYRQAIEVAPHTVREERTLVRPDGSSAPYEIQRLAFLSEGRWVIATTWRDLSERNATQLRLEQLSEAIEQASDGIAVIDPDKMEFLHINEAAPRLWRVARDEMLARGPIAVWERWGRNSEDYKRSFRELIEKYPASETIDDILVDHETGERIVLERRRRAVRVHGRWLIVSVNRDVTERRAEQDRLERLQAAINQAAEAIVIIDPDTMRYVEANEAAANLWRVARKRMLADDGLAIALKAWGRTATGDGHVFSDVIATAPRAQHVEEVCVHAVTGRRIVVERSRRAVRAKDRWLIISVARDVTARHAERDRLDRLHAAVEQAPDGIFIVDERTGYLDVNEAAGRMLGVSRAELLARGVAWTGAQIGLVHPQDPKVLMARVVAAHPDPVVEEIAVRQADGAMRHVEATRRAVKMEGRWLVISVWRDITERKAAHARLEQLSAAINQASESIVLIDAETLTYVEANEAAGRLWGCTREALLARGVPWVWQRLGVTEGDVRRRYVELIRVNPEVLTQEYRARRDDDSEMYVEYSLRAVRAGDRWLIVTIAHNITARKQAEAAMERQMAELSRSNQELEQFAYVISHDLTEPLRMVASYTQLLERRHGSRLDGDAREFMAFIVDGARRMKRMIDDLLLYSRAGRPRARASANASPLPLDEALDDALANLTAALRDSGARIERDPLPTVMAERVAMVQLFQNLVGNAIKFRGTGPSVVRIGASDAGDAWELSVSDNGIGIAPVHFDRIFVVFQRLHAAADYEGTGIGLAICKKIVERHGGRIWVESQPGAGATFRFLLPKMPLHSAQAALTTAVDAFPASRRITERDVARDEPANARN